MSESLHHKYRGKHPDTATGLNPEHERRMCLYVLHVREAKADQEIFTYQKHTTVNEYLRERENQAHRSIAALVNVNMDIEQPKYKWPPKLPDGLRRFDLKDGALVRYILKYFESWSDEKLALHAKGDPYVDDEDAAGA